MLRAYDPSVQPNPTHWLEASESERLRVVSAYCESDESDVPNMHLHSTYHVAVETQIAMGQELPVAGTLTRIMAEGLSRHDAVHAIGSILAKHIYGVLKGEEPTAENPNIEYYESLSNLTAAHWLASSESRPPKSVQRKAKKRRKRRKRKS